MNNNQRICRKCLLSDIAQEDFLKNMRNYINNMDPDIKTDKNEYVKRIAACRECEHLYNGLCNICGCFVEYRAAVRSNYCPEVNKRW